MIHILCMVKDGDKYLPDFIAHHLRLVDKIWFRKKKRIKNKFYTLPQISVGKSYNSKVNKIVQALKKSGADFQFITASENNAWLMNIRGNDS